MHEMWCRDAKHKRQLGSLLKKGATTQAIYGVSLDTFHEKRGERSHSGVGFMDASDVTVSDRRSMLVATLRVFGVQAVLHGEPRCQQLLTQLYSYHARSIFAVDAGQYCIDGAPPEVFRRWTAGDIVEQYAAFKQLASELVIKRAESSQEPITDSELYRALMSTPLAEIRSRGIWACCRLYHRCVMASQTSEAYAETVPAKKKQLPTGWLRWWWRTGWWWRR